MTTTPAAPFSAARYIKEIGRGVNGARALPREDAQTLFDAMLAGRVSDIELGAVLMAYRIKGEAPHELAGMLEAAHRHCLPLAAPPDRPVVVIPSYNGARKQPNLVPLLALLLARDGVPTLVHGSRAFHGRVTSMALFEALGVPLCATTRAAQDQLRDASHPLAVLPIYSAMSNISRDHLEIASDLGSRRLYLVRTILIPMALPGVNTAFAFTFLLAAGDFVTPNLVGGSQGIMIGNVIADQFRGTGANWPLGAALALVTVCCVMLIVWAVNRVIRWVTRW